MANAYCPIEIRQLQVRIFSMKRVLAFSAFLNNPMMIYFQDNLNNGINIDEVKSEVPLWAEALLCSGR